MFSIQAHPARNQLEISINHIDDEEDLKTILFMLRREVRLLRDNWTVAADLRGMRVLEQRLTRYIQQTHELLLRHGALRIATLVDNSILKMQITRIGNETGANRIAARFTNETEWRQFIETPPRMSGPGPRNYSQDPF